MIWLWHSHATKSFRKDFFYYFDQNLLFALFLCSNAKNKIKKQIVPKWLFHYLHRIRIILKRLSDKCRNSVNTNLMKQSHSTFLFCSVQTTIKKWFRSTTQRCRCTTVCCAWLARIRHSSVKRSQHIPTWCGPSNTWYQGPITMHR